MSYRDLKSYQQATVIYDFTFEFCERYMTYKTNKSHRTYDQMFQAARSGKQNIVEGSSNPTSEKSEARAVRELAYKSNRAYETYKSYMENSETAANAAICLINQVNFLLDRQISACENEFVSKWGYTENLFKKRNEAKKKWLIDRELRKYE